MNEHEQAAWALYCAETAGGMDVRDFWHELSPAMKAHYLERSKPWIANIFPEDSAARKEYPVFSGLLQYFPSALAAIAHHSFKGNEKHNPGLPLHHDRAKSSDEPDALVRHLMEGDYVGMAWRALSLLQKHCEAQGAPLAPSARNVARQLCDETSAIAAAQDAAQDIDWSACFPTRAQLDAKREAMAALTDLATEGQKLGLYDDGIPAESAYLASFSPNGSRIATSAEIEGLRDVLATEELKGFGIGDVPHEPPCVTDPSHPLHHVTLNGPEDRL